VRRKIKQGWLAKKKGQRGNKWELKYVQVNEEYIEYYSARIKVLFSFACTCYAAICMLHAAHVLVRLVVFFPLRRRSVL